MIRENQKFLNKIQVIMDMAIIVISFLLAYLVKEQKNKLQICSLF